MATEPPPPRSGANWLWIILIALLGILLIVWLLDPSGDTDDGAVEDPIVMPDPAAPAADGPNDTALPEPGATASPTGASLAPAQGQGNEAEPPPPPAE